MGKIKYADDDANKLNIFFLQQKLIQFFQNRMKRFEQKIMQQCEMV